MPNPRLPTLLLMLAAAPLSAAIAADAAVETLEHGVVVHPTATGSAAVRIEAVAPGILRVSADPDGDFKRSASVMRADAGTPPSVKVEQGVGVVTIATTGISAQVALADGHVQFFDAAGKPLLSEGARSFSPQQVEGRDYYSIRQRFESPPDEAFYGTGLHQQGWMNLKGRDVELAQANIDKAIPYLMSSRGYGILWDSNAITRYGDPRGLQPLDASLDVFDAEGKPGALTATYAIDGKTTLVRREANVDYQYLSDQPRFPEEGKNMATGGRSTVVWEGEVAARSTGRHTFSMYSSEYAKLWIDGKLVLDRWRQNWNPWYHELVLPMAAGERHKVRLEWDRIEPSYIALLHRDPLPAAEAADLSIWSELAQEIDYYVVAGADSNAVLAGYRTLTGKATLLPKWAYGFWQSRERYKTQDELLTALEGYRSRKLPIDNIVEDWSYWPENAWGSHDFDAARFPDPAGMVKKVHDQHAQVMISVWPKFYPETKNFQELDAAGHMYRGNIEAGERDWIGPGYHSSFYDPYSKEGRQIFWRQLDGKLNKLGFDAWWLDADEPDLHGNLDIDQRKARTTPTAMGPGAEFFNSFPLMHSEGVYTGSREVNDDKRVFILSRAFFAGQQRAGSAFWSGDIVPRWDDLREQISGLVNASMAGAPNVSFDIGGFAPENRYISQDPAHVAEWRELNLRWFQYGAFVPIFRLHGQFPYREIWEIAPEGTPQNDSFVYYLKLRYSLLPYVYTLAGDTWHKDGTILRALAMDFGNDPKARDVADEYLFGPAFLVAPVTTFGATSRPVYLPAGAQWVDFASGRRFDGGQTIEAAAPQARMPLFVRAGSIVPRTVVQQYVDEQPEAPLTIEVYTGADGEFSLYEDAGRDYGYERGEFSRIPLHWDEAAGELKVGAREGSWPGMVAKRELHVRWIDGPRDDAGALEPKADVTVKYDGSAISVRKP